jgi:monoamine oxidase
MRRFLSADPRQQIPPRVAQRNEIAAGKLTNGAGMGVEDLVKMTTFLIDANDIAKVRTARMRVLGSHRPASTLLVISRLAAPEYLIEIEATAAKA